MPTIRPSEEIEKEIEDLADQLAMCKKEQDIAYRREGKVRPKRKWTKKQPQSQPGPMT